MMFFLKYPSYYKRESCDIFVNLYAQDMVITMMQDHWGQMGVLRVRWQRQYMKGFENQCWRGGG